LESSKTPDDAKTFTYVRKIVGYITDLAVRVDVADDDAQIRLKEKKNARERARSEQTLHITQGGEE